jgi:protein O-mannosyl-transferase
MPSTKLKRKRKTIAQTVPKHGLGPLPISSKLEVSTEATEERGFLWKRRVAPAILLAFVTFAIYYQVIHHPFSNYDDSEYVQGNPNIQGGVTPAMLRWAWTSIDHANWHPVTWISHALDWQLFGPDPTGHHVTSLLLHMLSVVVLFWFLAEVTRSPVRAFLAATLFAVHPVSVESVAWIAERKNVLCGLFFLLALLAYAGYARRPRVIRYSLVALLFGVGLAAKAMVVTFPFVLLLLDFWPLQRIRNLTQPSQTFPAPQLPIWKIVLEKVPWLALAIADCAVTLIAQRKAGAIRSAIQFPFFLRVENAVVSYATYVWNAAWPMHLSVLYPFPSAGLPVWRVLLSAAFLASVSVWVYRERSRHPYLLTGWCWFLGMLVPVLGLVQVGEQGMADRYAYLPLIGIYVALVWGCFDLAQTVSTRTRPWLAVAAAVILVFVSVLARRQVGLWQSNLELWSHAVDVTENNSAAEDVVGSQLLMDAFNKGLRYSDDALIHFQNALRIDPKDSQALLYLGMDLQARGKPVEAIDRFNMALQYVDDNWLKSKILSGIAGSYEVLGDFAKARQYYSDALKVNPKPDSESFMGYARTFTDEEIAKLTPTLNSHPTAQGYWQLGQLQETAGRNDEARSAYQHALELDPHFEAAQVARSKK